MLCGAKYRIYYVCSNAPGSNHDSHIFKTSALFRTLMVWRPFRGAVIGGDSAFPTRLPYLLTPYLDAIAMNNPGEYPMFSCMTAP